MNARFLMSRFRVGGLVALVALVQACGGGGDGITVTIPPCTPVDLTFPGAASGTTEDCTSGGFRAKVYRFTADANNANGFSVSSAFPNLGVEITTDPPGTNNVVWVDTDGDVAAEWALPAGQYLLRVTSRTGSGTFSLDGYTTALDASDCTIRTLVVGITLTDRALATTDCEYLSPGANPQPDGTYFDAYGILSSKPCTISMSSATMDSFLQIRNAGMTTVLAANDDNGMSLDSFVSLAECNNNDGPIVILANTATTTPATGSYTLVVTIVGGGSVVARNTISTPKTFGGGASVVSPGAKLAKTR